MKNPLSEKQLYALQEANARLNIWEGSVRSGKTFSSIIKFLIALSRGPKGAAMIVGVSRDAIQRNILPELCGMAGLRIPTPKSSQMMVFGRIVHIVGANDERAQRRIQGSTLAMAYVDELTLIPQGFFKMLLSRLSVPGAQLFATTNPDSPFHWLKTDFIDREGTDEHFDLKTFKFRLDDNPSLTKQYIDSLKAEYSGLWYQRYIDGAWVLAEGLVYDFFDEEDHVLNAPPGIAKEYVIGVDYGTTNPTVFLKIGFNPEVYPNIWVEDEYYYDSRKYNRQKSDTEYIEEFRQWLGPIAPGAVYVDPSAASLRVEMQHQAVPNVRDADNDVINGIRFVGNLLSNGTLKVCKKCTNLIKEIQTYRWDDKASARGEDKPLKENDHASDSLRYAIFTHFKGGITLDADRDTVDQAWNAARGISQELPRFFQDNYDSNSGRRAGGW